MCFIMSAGPVSQKPTGCVFMYVLAPRWPAGPWVPGGARSHCKPTVALLVRRWRPDPRRRGVPDEGQGDGECKQNDPGRHDERGL